MGEVEKIWIVNEDSVLALSMNTMRGCYLCCENAHSRPCIGLQGIAPSTVDLCTGSGARNMSVQRCSLNIKICAMFCECIWVLKFRRSHGSHTGSASVWWCSVLMRLCGRGCSVCLFVIRWSWGVSQRPEGQTAGVPGAGQVFLYAHCATKRMRTEQVLRRGQRAAGDRCRCWWPFEGLPCPELSSRWSTRCSTSVHSLWMGTRRQGPFPHSPCSCTMNRGLHHFLEDYYGFFCFWGVLDKIDIMLSFDFIPFGFLLSSWDKCSSVVHKLDNGVGWEYSHRCRGHRDWDSCSPVGVNSGSHCSGLQN